MVIALYAIIDTGLQGLKVPSGEYSMNKIYNLNNIFWHDPEA